MGWAAALALIVAGLGMSAQAAIRAIVEHRDRGPAAHALISRPASVFAAVAPTVVTAPPASPAPRPGTTGTVTPPALPPGAAFLIAPVLPVAARPFSSVGASALDRGRALECLTAALYYEAASESDDGQRAVAQVVLNRVRHPAFPNSVCGVVYQGSEHGGCQFSFACDGSTARVMPAGQRARSARIAAAALAGQVFAPVGLATHYHTYAVTPGWNRALVMTDALGAHFFHRWKGYWGTPAAFTQVYAGNEPVPGPHVAVQATVAVAPLATPAPTAVSGAPATPAAVIDPPHVDSGALIASAGPPQSTALDRWKDSGKPLR